MSILVQSPTDNERWVDEFRRLLPDHDVECWPDVAVPAAVEYLVMWRHDPSDMARYTNLRAILSLGAGVEQFLDTDLPDVPIVRLADPAMADEMAVYAVSWVTHFQRHHDVYLADQAKTIWKELPYTPAAEYTIGILGHGTIGRCVGQAFAGLGYPIAAWSRTGGDEPGIEHYVGSEQIGAFLAACDAVINVLPNTPDTAGLMNSDRFASMQPHAVFVNIGRGSTVVEDDLAAALYAGRPAAAVLDVTSIEPLPPESPLWKHPNIRITPHSSGPTRLGTAARLIAANIDRLDRGEQPFPILDRSNGY